ncbi:MAG: hypothetical protein DKT66_23305 [Candidatus Melainabacteria bacterium]|nr:MAG: hypothetical protein DKT66_23305 [Candidatus Melainabacteria bacterium]
MPDEVFGVKEAKKLANSIAKNIKSIFMLTLEVDRIITSDAADWNAITPTTIGSTKQLQALAAVQIGTYDLTDYALDVLAIHVTEADFGALVKANKELGMQPTEIPPEAYAMGTSLGWTQLNVSQLNEILKSEKNTGGPLTDLVAEKEFVLDASGKLSFAQGVQLLQDVGELPTLMESYRNWRLSPSTAAGDRVPNGVSVDQTYFDKNGNVITSPADIDVAKSLALIYSMSTDLYVVWDKGTNTYAASHRVGNIFDSKRTDGLTPDQEWRLAGIGDLRNAFIRQGVGQKSPSYIAYTKAVTHGDWNWNPQLKSIPFLVDPFNTPFSPEVSVLNFLTHMPTSPTVDDVYRVGADLFTSAAPFSILPTPVSLLSELSRLAMDAGLKNMGLMSEDGKINVSLGANPISPGATVLDNVVNALGNLSSLTSGITVKIDNDLRFSSDSDSDALLALESILTNTAASPFDVKFELPGGRLITANAGSNRITFIGYTDLTEVNQKSGGKFLQVGISQNNIIKVQKSENSTEEYFINEDLPNADNIIQDLLQSNPNSSATTFSDDTGVLQLEKTYYGGNVLEQVAASTGISPTVIAAANPTLAYNPTTNLSQIFGPLYLPTKALSSTVLGTDLLRRSIGSLEYIDPSIATAVYGAVLLKPNVVIKPGINPVIALPLELAPAYNVKPIGAFYESSTLVDEQAVSITELTPRLFNGTTAVATNQLSSFDSNSNGIIDSSDSSYANLNVWEDQNEDGIVDDGEMTNLSDAGIASIPVNGSAIAFTSGNSKSVVAQDIDALETSLQVSNPTAPTIDYDYYRNTFEQAKLDGSGNWASNEIKATYDGQYKIGTTAADTIYFGNVPNILGGDGDDILRSDWHNNKIWGGTGNDAIIGALGDDTLIGEDGDDAIQGFYPLGANEPRIGNGETDNDLIFGGAGKDSLWGQAGNDTISGDDGDDLVKGFVSGNDTKSSLGAYETDTDLLFGGAGNDTVFGGVGNDTISGGADNDLMVGFYNLADRKQTLSGSETDADLMFGGEGNDTVVGDVGNDTLFGDAGNDVIGGFTFGNDTKQTLAAGETDNDLISGGLGNDTVFGGAGDDDVYGESGDDLLIGYSGLLFGDISLPIGETDNDTLWGGEGNDLLLGQQGNDFLLGGDGDDLQLGQVGNDTIYGQEGDDILGGFTGYNESKQTLTGNETDDDFLYGGAGNDTLVGALGNDYLDGGANADYMEGGDGNDIYVVNTINDVVLERASGGTDTVLSSVNYLLSTEVENLYLLGDGDISGSGNKRDNAIYGTIGSNILDGETGADTMVGYAGDDDYYVDNVNDVVTEQANEGSDTVNSSISWTLGANQENLTLLSYKIAERGVIDGIDVLVYGYPKRYELDYSQGDAVPDFLGTCALTAISNVITQAAGSVTEEQVVTYAKDNDLAVEGSTSFDNGGTTRQQQQDIITHFLGANSSDYSLGVNFVDMANKIKNGQGVLLAVNAGSLWDDTAYFGDGDRNHVITVSGAVYNSDNTRIMGFYICDSGRGLVSDMTRYVSYADLFDAANVPGGYMIWTTGNLKLWNTNIDGTGNSLDNLIVGTDGNNVLTGGAGVDSMVGGAGNDTFIVDNIDELIFENTNEGTDSVQSSVTYTIVDNIENLTLTGSSNINATGNSGNNTLTGNSGNNILDGGAGNDTMTGGAGNDTYYVDASGDSIIENSAEGIDTVFASANYVLGSNLENLTLTGTGAVSGTGNSLENRITDNGASGNTLIGGLANDTYVVTNSSDVIVENANEGYDTVETSVSYDFTGTNVDIIKLTGSAALTIVGDGNVSTFYDNAGASTIYGGEGVDAYWIHNSNTVIVEGASPFYTDVVMADVSYTLSDNIEQLFLHGSANINGYAGNGDQGIVGNGGDNYLSGGAGNDGLAGTAGNDTLDGGTGNDGLSGGTGNDLFIVDSAGDNVYEYANEGTDSVQSSISFTLSSNVENLTLTGSSSLTGTGNTLDNLITGNSGASTLVGGTGNDQYIVSTSNTVIIENSSEGTDSVSSNVTYTLGANVENLTLTGSSAISGRGNASNNYLTGNSGSNTLTGDDGNDTLDGGAGVDSMVGGLGNDVYYIDSASDAISESAAQGSDSVVSDVSYTLGSEVENLTLTGSSSLTGTGNTSNNFLTGNTGANTLAGADGNDTLDGGTGADSMVGGLGNDTFYVDNAGDAVSEGTSAGTDTVISSLSFTLATDFENLTLSGSSNINATGNSFANVITGNSGNNSIDGSTGNDTMAGGAGNDTYVVDSTNDVATENASEGTDTVNSSVTWTLGANFENLTITGASVANATGNSLDNYLTGSTAANSITGAAGNDTIDGSTGTDTLVGGTGDDTYYLDVTTDVVTENASEGTDTVNIGLTYTLGNNVENLTLTGASIINGVGNTLNNYMVGNSAKNSLTGSDGNDTLDGGLGNDTLIGGLGDDVFYVDNASDTITEVSGAGTDTEVASFTDTLANNLENLTLAGSANINATGNSLTNVLTGNSGDNVLDGANGTDTLIGGAGNDTYVIDTDIVTENANEGTDTVQSGASYTLGANLENLTLTSGTIGAGNGLDNYIIGNSSANSLVGAAGNDTLDGGSGTDTMIGGTGDDVYFVSTASELPTENSGEGLDTVNSAVSYTLGSNLENLTLTGSSNNSATGNTLNNVITGNSGDNTISGGTGGEADTMSGGAGDDTYVLDSTSDVVVENLNAGADLVQAGFSYTLTDNVESLTLTGTSSTNATGNSLANTLTGNSGNNSLDGGLGADTMVGGSGDDTYVVDNAGDVVTESSSSGTDTVKASINYTLASNVDNLTLTGSSDLTATGNTLANVLTGNSGNNVFDSTSGSAVDTLIGGLGNDTYIVDSTADLITENSNEGIDTVQSSVTYTLGANVENLTITSSGTGKGNTLNNYILGSSNANTLIGGAGNDTLNGNGGNDSFTGDAGDDLFYVDSTGDVVSEAVNEGTDTVSSTIAYTLGANLENLTLTGAGVINGTGNSLNNIIIGNSSANVLDGSTGADTMSGGAGSDTYVVDDVNDQVIENVSEGTDLIQSSVSFDLALTDNVENLTLTGTAVTATGNGLNNTITGNASANILFGAAGSDALSGGSGNDILDGGSGADTMTGGTGDDNFYIDNASDAIVENLNEGTDTVFSTINYTLGTYTEALVLLGNGNTTATGNTGNNVIIGSEGDNTLDGGAGTDTMRGGLGNDTYMLDTISDNIAEDVGGGIDTVKIAASYTLGANFENLTLTGSGTYTATGNALDNTLTDNGVVANTLVGGQGNDTYVIHLATDGITEINGEGTDTVQSYVSYTLGSYLENLTLAGTATLGVGNALDNVITGNALADTLTGGTGNDTYVVSSNTTVIVENASEGTDAVNSFVTYTLASNVENLVLVGSSAINGTGNSLNNVMTGNSASNSLSGLGGNDSLLGGDGNDTLDGGTGDDTLVGGMGNDAYFVDTSNDVVTENSAEGTDTVNSAITYTLGTNVENLTLTGTSAINGVGNALDNMITGNSGANSLTGAGGNDTLDGGTGIDTLIGGLGDDAYVVDSNTDIITENASEGTDTVNSSASFTLGSNVENLTLTGSAVIGMGNTLDNVITGNSASNSLSGASGNDTLNGGSGGETDTLVGGTGNDVYYVDASADVVTENSAEGTDTVSSSVTYTLSSNVENIVLTGSSAINGVGNTLDNMITGNTGANSLSGSDGNDTLDGGLGADTLAGGLGNDVFVVNSSSDVVNEVASQGTDTVISDVDWTLGSEVENLILADIETPAVSGTGNTLDNTITGNSANNSLSGAAGNDSLDGGIGNDTLVGGLGNDTYLVDSSDDVVTESASQGTDTVMSAISWSLGANLENLSLTGTGSVNGSGNSLDNVITGNEASNILFGDAGNDSIVGGDGFDTLDGGTGNDTMSGGVGNDTYFVDSATDVVTESANEGIDTVNSTITYTLGSNVENLTLFGSAAINAVGNSLDNRILGSAGANSMTGGAGNDTLNGEVGADTMIGGTGDDTYYVDDVNDVLTENSAEGNDTVYSTANWTLGSYLENLVLTGFAGLTGAGNNLSNAITGGDGNDTLVDTLLGADGNDTLDGGLGNDTLIGGIGDDSYVVDSEADVVIENASEGTDTVESIISYTLGANVENLTLLDVLDISGYGNSADNVIIGNVGFNSLSGGAGNDSLNASEGDDTLDGGSGNDTLVGALGDDLYLVDSATDIVTENADEGTDTVFSTVHWTLGSNVENLTLQGASAINGIGNTLDNVIKGNTAANALTGDAGNDTLNGSIGADTLDGGAGDDTYFVDNSGDSIIDASGNDTVISSISWTLSSTLENLSLSGYGITNLNGAGNGGDNTITGDRGDNSLFGAAGNDSLSGGIGNDTLDGGTNNDTMEGGSGNDTYIVDSANDVVIETNYFDGLDLVQSSVNWTLGAYLEDLTLTGSGNVNATGNTWDNVLTGNTGNNVLTDDFGNDTLYGGAGNDTLDGGTGTNYLIGGTGNDTYYVRTATDAVGENSGEGTDTIISSVSITIGDEAQVENITLLETAFNAYGNSLDNFLLGNVNDNILSGGAGNDSLDGVTGADTMIGGLGNDLYYFNSADDFIIENSNEGIDTVISNLDLTLVGSNLDNLTMIGTATTGEGNNLDNYILGNSSNNTLLGGAGNDTLDGGTGNDSLVGGLGDDVYVIDSVNDFAIENANEGIDTVISTLSVDLTGSNFENVTLTGGFSAVGNTADNILIGSTASNSLTGGAGNDTLDGGSGSGAFDWLVGGAGDDTYILSENANDSIAETSGQGTDTVKSMFTYSLASTELENLVLTGTSAINGTGNGYDNVLTGNSGSNSLSGAGGNDTYNFGVGGGTDTVSDSGGTLDKVSFDNSLDKDDIAFFMSGNDLQMGYLGNSDQVTVQSQNVSGNKVERFQLSDGKYLTDSEVNTMIQSMASYAAAHSIGFTSLSDVKSSSDLMNIISNSWHA